MAYLRITAGSAAILVSLGAARAARADCYVDSVAGNDSRNAQSEAEAVQSQAAIPTSCTVVRYKRGSDFNEPVKVIQKVTTYANYGAPCDPLPKFHIPRSTNNGSIFRSYSSGITIDGLYMSGSMSDAAMTNLMNGVCVGMGGNSKLLNSEITNCDIGVMIFGDGSLVQGNYIHDLYISVDAAPGVDPNQVGGAEGIFINGSNNEVAYNSFIRCSSTAEWTGGSCDGGATEVTVGANGATLSGVKVHHNFSYKSCGFFEVSSMAGSAKGIFADSEFYNNVSIDSGWLMLLQVNNTDLSNIKWTNNTVVQHKSDSINPGMLVTVFNQSSSGMTGGDLVKDTVFLINDLFILDGFGAQDYVSPLHENLNLVNTLTLKGTSPGVVNLAGTEAADFDLVEGSPAIDQGTSTTHTIDYLNRTAPAGSAMDVGAFEYGSSLASGQTAPVPAHDAVTGKACGNTGGTPGTGGTSSGGTNTATGGASSASGGTTPSTTGGTSSGGTNTATGGTSSATGGSATVTGGSSTATPTGGTSAGGGGAKTGGSSSNTVTGGTSTTTPTGGTSSTVKTGGTSSTDPVTGGSGSGTPTSTGGASSGTSTGGTTSSSTSTGGSESTQTSSGGASNTGSGTTGGGANEPGTTGGSGIAGLGLNDTEGGCGCRTVGTPAGSRGGFAAVLGLLAGSVLLRRRRIGQKG